MNDIIFGIHAVGAMLEHAPERILEIFVSKDREDPRLESLLKNIAETGISQQKVNRQWLDLQSENGVHQGILARIQPVQQFNENYLQDLLETHPAPFFLILDGVTDPHNLGACLRSADAAGVTAVIVPKDHSAPLTATAKKVACGAAEFVPLIRVTNLARTIKLLKENNIWVVGAAGEAKKSLFDAELSGALALVMGAEDKGMRRLTRENCDDLVFIPMCGYVSSLNVSVATGICLFEVVRQRKNK